MMLRNIFVAAASPDFFRRLPPVACRMASSVRANAAAALPPSNIGDRCAVRRNGRHDGSFDKAGPGPRR